MIAQQPKEMECEYCHTRMPKEKVRDNNRCILCGHQMVSVKPKRQEKKLDTFKQVQL